MSALKFRRAEWGKFSKKLMFSESAGAVLYDKQIASHNRYIYIISHCGCHRGDFEHINRASAVSPSVRLEAFFLKTRLIGEHKRKIQNVL